MKENKLKIIGEMIKVSPFPKEKLLRIFVQMMSTGSINMPLTIRKNTRMH